MIAQLSELSQAASPTPFHHLLRSLDDRGKLLRVYTQNIDAIESKSGLSFGVPEFDDRRKSRKATAANSVEDPSTPVPTHSQPSSSRLPSPPEETPRCIPLHGTLQTLHCQTCTHTFPLEDHLSSLTSGTPPYCPECTAMEETRQLVGKRARGVGKLRPSVVLYNEMHKDGEGVGEAVRKDLVGGSKGKGRSGADLLLVVGTSLRVPGTKRIVREFAKAVHSRTSASASKDGASSSGPATPAPSPRRTPCSDDDASLKSVYLNFDFPVPTREWEGVFDAWIQGDAQSFAAMLEQEIEKEARLKEAAVEKKKRREEDALLAASQEANGSEAVAGKKRKSTPSSKSASATKKRKMSSLPPTPTSIKGKRKGVVNGKGKVKATKSPQRKRLVAEVVIPTVVRHKPEPLDREADLANLELGGRWKRGPLVLPGQADVPPIVNIVDDYRSFKMFDAGWILPESQKRRGRAAVERTPLPTRRRRTAAAIESPSSTTTPISSDQDDNCGSANDLTEEPGELPSFFVGTADE